MSNLQLDITVDGGSASSTDAIVTAIMTSSSGSGTADPVVSGLLFGGM